MNEVKADCCFGPERKKKRGILFEWSKGKQRS